MTTTPTPLLDYYLKDGCCQLVNFGAVKVPEGFAVLQMDDGYYIGIGPNGEESNINCRKAPVLKWCKFKAAQLAAAAQAAKESGHE